MLKYSSNHSFGGTLSHKFGKATANTSFTSFTG